MSTETQSNNKRIAKNVMMLYIRMFLIMAVSLFTSRVVLQVLGVDDFGIYNVVGGIVAMMGVLNGAMSVSTQRYLTFELGKGDMERLKKTFSVSFEIYILLGLIFLVLAETVGLWFLNTQLHIPGDRMAAANWVYQFSSFTVMCKLIVNPYNASIIAHEKMNIYAYISIIEVFLQLGIVYLLLVIPYDRLSAYGTLMFLMSFSVTMIYRIYCTRHYEECRFRFVKDKALFKELLSYSGWNLFGALSGVVKGQGLNVLLSMFFNPSVNAARGISYQINSAITHFFTNFYTAVRPQITKYYAQNDLTNMFKLVFRSSKMSFYLILIISLPILVETPYIVNLWLGQLPEYVVPFTRLIVAISAIDAMANPLMTTAHATGKIALYQSSVGTMTILNIPISFVLLKYVGASPVAVFQVSLCIAVICLFMRLGIVKRLVNFPVLKYIKEVFGTSLLVAATASILPVYIYLHVEENLKTVIIVCLLCILTTMCSIWTFGLKNDEKVFVRNIINKKILHKK